MQLILLAAGRGSRLPKKYRDSPKGCVNINKKTLFNYNVNFYSKFKKKIIITGFKKEKLKKFISCNNFQEIFNKNYKNTNMVESMFLAKNKIHTDVIVCYSDIVFDKLVYDILKKKGNCIPLNMNWLNLWKKRMSLKSIYKDAENVILKNKSIIEIGSKLEDKLPKYQFMGLVKIKHKSFNLMYNFYRELKNSKIDMTNFINLCIKNKVVKFSYIKYKKKWLEIDSMDDIKLAKKTIQ